MSDPGVAREVSSAGSAPRGWRCDCRPRRDAAAAAFAFVAAARREVDATPPEWAGFVRRNAELAARLVSPAGSTGRNDRDGL
jgi:hypothetical protein